MNLDCLSRRPACWKARVHDRLLVSGRKIGRTIPTSPYLTRLEADRRTCCAPRARASNRRLRLWHQASLVHGTDLKTWEAIDEISAGLDSVLADHYGSVRSAQWVPGHEGLSYSGPSLHDLALASSQASTLPWTGADESRTMAAALPLDGSKYSLGGPMERALPPPTQGLVPNVFGFDYSGMTQPYSEYQYGPASDAQCSQYYGQQASPSRDMWRSSEPQPSASQAYCAGLYAELGSYPQSS